MSEKNLLQTILLRNSQHMTRIQDFLISEIDTDNLQETIDFIKSSDKKKIENYEDILYTGNTYTGIFLEGNQYLISSSQDQVLIIDMISEEKGVSVEQTRVKISITDFIELVSNKQKVIKLIKERKWYKT